MRHTLKTLLLAACLAAPLGACSTRVGRVAMNLRPGDSGVVRVDGDRPRVRIDTVDADNPVQVDVEPLGDTRGREHHRTVAMYVATHDGPTRFTLTNQQDEEVLVEVKAKNYEELVVERVPRHAAAGDPAIGETP